MCECNVRCDPVRVQGLTAAVLGAGCQLLLIAGCRETLLLGGDARGCNGHRRRRMVRLRPTRVRCPSRFARKPRLRAIAFLEVQLEIWWCGYVTVRHDSEVKAFRDSGPRNLSGASGLGQDLTGFAKRYLRQRFFLGGGRGAREIDVDVDEGADNAVQRRISHRHFQHLEN